MKSSQRSRPLLARLFAAIRYPLMVSGVVATAFFTGCRDEEDATAGNGQPQPAAEAPAGMKWIPGGKFTMGSSSSFAKPDERPEHVVEVKGFWMDETEVTNAQFRAFVDATGYVTRAEKTPTLDEFPEDLRQYIDPADLKAGANHFKPCDTVDLQQHLQWWEYKHGASWKTPDGPGSSIEGKDDYPVVCITWDDAVAYTKWAGKRLPTEAEWEFAARGGMNGQIFVWGNEMHPEGKWMSNIYQGDFPKNDTGEDGYIGASPVKAFPANGFGLYDMSGNVWEFVNDWYKADYYQWSPAKDPQGPRSSDDRQGGSEPNKVIRGGSFLCNDCYCSGYRPSARQTTTLDSSSNHTGFRCVKDAE
ncbi:MAG: formylglycine-generating enzyme family protein [Verrucomicrobiae bacterium]|nr:formylglycine-generating enzyme family protein [Verrucomicrobiae bacterium]